MTTIPNLIERGHTILDLAPRDYSAITNLVTDAYKAGQAQAWEDGFTQGAAYYQDLDHPPTAYTETAQTLNPHKENQ